MREAAEKQTPFPPLRPAPGSSAIGTIAGDRGGAEGCEPQKVLQLLPTLLATYSLDKQTMWPLMYMRQSCWAYPEGPHTDRGYEQRNK